MLFNAKNVEISLNPLIVMTSKLVPVVLVLLMVVMIILEDALRTGMTI